MADKTSGNIWVHIDMPSTHYTSLLRLQTNSSGHSALIYWSWDPKSALTIMDMRLQFVKGIKLDGVDGT
jgi:hypothetical protein